MPPMAPIAASLASNDWFECPLSPRRCRADATPARFYPLAGAAKRPGRLLRQPWRALPNPLENQPIPELERLTRGAGQCYKERLPLAREVPSDVAHTAGGERRVLCGAESRRSDLRGVEGPGRQRPERGDSGGCGSGTPTRPGGLRGTRRPRDPALLPSPAVRARDHRPGARVGDRAPA